MGGGTPGARAHQPTPQPHTLQGAAGGHTGRPVSWGLSRIRLPVGGRRGATTFPPLKRTPHPSGSTHSPTAAPTPLPPTLGFRVGLVFGVLREITSSPTHLGGCGATCGQLFHGLSWNPWASHLKRGASQWGRHIWQAPPHKTCIPAAELHPETASKSACTPLTPPPQLSLE